MLCININDLSLSFFEWQKFVCRKCIEKPMSEDSGAKIDFHTFNSYDTKEHFIKKSMYCL